MKPNIPVSLLVTLALAACSSDNSDADTGDQDIVEQDVVEDTDEDTSEDTEEDVEEDTDEEDTAPDDDADADSPDDADAGPSDDADATEDTTPVVVIPPLVPGEPAVIEDGTELREIGPEGACGTPVELVGRGLRRSPYVQSVFTDSARIAWTDTFGASGFVRYSVAGSGEWRTVDANVRAFDTVETTDTEDYNAYDATLVGLEPDQDVCYEVYVDGALLVARTAFHTAWTTHEKPVRIITMGDSGNASAEQYALRDEMMKMDSDVFLHLGDMAYGDGTYPEFEERVFQVYEGLMAQIPAWPTPGNHEYKTGLADGYIGTYYLPEQAMNEADQEYYYSFDYGNVHFISLDSNEYRMVTTLATLGTDMLDWLEADLEATDADWIIAFMHHPVYSSGSHGNTRSLHNYVVPLLEEHNVDLILAGHDHHYERTFPILDGTIVEDESYAPTYVVAGAGGAGLRETTGNWWTDNLNFETHTFLHFVIDGCTGTGTTINLNGDVTDTFTINGCTR